MTTSPVTQIFDLPEGLRTERVISKISSNFETVTPPARRIRLRYYDTFDWRLYAERLALIRVNEEFRLRNLNDDSTLAACRASGEPGFWWEFPEGRMRDHFRKILEVRALLVMGDVGLRIRDIRVLNADAKTVVRARLEEGEAFDGGKTPAPVRLINVLPVRGYRKDARRLAKFLEEFDLQPTTRSTFEVAVEMQGRKPGDYSSKLRLTLNAEMSAQQAAAVICRQLLDTIVRNEKGIREDIDTEFLHDFRVAIRRTRSCLSQMKGVLPPGIKEDYLARFAELGRSTNRLRDLDVYLLSRKDYQNMLADDARHALNPLFDALSDERDEALAAVVRTINGNRYRTLLKEWRETLAAFGSPAMRAKNAEVPVGKLSRRFIRKRYGRVLALGGRIGPDSPDEDLHALRIDCKKLRYLLEFFSSLYPPGEVGVFIKQLKRLQDNLGEFNDLSVQRAELQSFLHKHRRQASVDTAAAIGALVARLEDRQKEVRNGFSGRFAAFTAQDNAGRFDHLFGKR
jgi:CHAD domain-containing protein